MTQENQVWYDNKPFGVNKLAAMIKDISERAYLSRIYTNHSIRATAITLWSNAQVPSRHIMAISGHRSEASLRNYNTRPSSEQLRVCSDILSDAMKERSQQSSTATSNLASSSLQSTSQQFVKYQPQALSSLFSNCNVTNVQVFMSHNSAGLH